MANRARAHITKEVDVDGVGAVHGVEAAGGKVWFAHGETGEVVAIDQGSGKRERSLRVPADAGVAFDGTSLWVAAGGRIRRVDPETGQVLADLPSPAGEDTSGVAYHAGSLWVGSYRAKKLYKLDAKTGQVKKTLESNRLVTGVTFRGDDLWHGAVQREPVVDTELRRLDKESGAVETVRALPEGVFVTGMGADDDGRIWCGDPGEGKLRVVEV